MERPSFWVPIVLLSLGILFLCEPHFQRSEEIFLRWLLNNSLLRDMAVLLTVVEIGSEQMLPTEDVKTAAMERSPQQTSSIPPPTEFALFLQAALEFKPTVIAFESVLKWPQSAKDEEQILVDQAIRVQKLLLGAELSATPNPNAYLPDISGFPQVTGRRDKLPKFSAVAQQPDEDLQVISTLGFINRPKQIRDNVHVPLLFDYRGEVIPSFALQAALLWMRIAPSEVKIDIGSSISLPNGKKIPIRLDGTALINPNMLRRARHISLDELLFQAQQRESKPASAAQFENMQGQIMLARTAPASNGSQDFVAATIAALQTNSFVRRVNWIFDFGFILTLAAASSVARKISRIDLVLVAIALTAAHCLIALELLSSWSIWLPGVLPLGAIWLVTLFYAFMPRA